jgi:hypothetical protein
MIRAQYYQCRASGAGGRRSKIERQSSRINLSDQQQLHRLIPITTLVRKKTTRRWRRRVV